MRSAALLLLSLPILSLTAFADVDHRTRMVFITNEDGMSRVYLLDPSTCEYRRVDNIPTGLVYGLTFSPNDIVSG